MTPYVKKRSESMRRMLYKNVARTGIEPATQGFSVLGNHFHQVPWLTLNHLCLAKCIGKLGFWLGNIGNRGRSQARSGNRPLRLYYGFFRARQPTRTGKGGRFTTSASNHRESHNRKENYICNFPTFT